MLTGRLAVSSASRPLEGAGAGWGGLYLGLYLYWPKRTTGSPREWLQHWPGGPHGHHRPNRTELRLSEAHVRMRHTAATRRRNHRKGKVVLFEDSFFNVSYINIFFSYTKRKRNNSRLTEPQALVTPPSGSRLSGGLRVASAGRLDTCHNEQPPSPLPLPALGALCQEWLIKAVTDPGARNLGPCRLCQLLSQTICKGPHGRRALSYCSWVGGGVVSEQWAVVYRDVYRRGHPSGSVAVLLSG